MELMHSLFFTLALAVLGLTSLSASASTSLTLHEMNRAQWQGVPRNEPAKCFQKLKNHELFHGDDPSMDDTIRKWCRMRDEGKSPWEGFKKCRSMLLKNIAGYPPAVLENTCLRYPVDVFGACVLQQTRTQRLSGQPLDTTVFESAVTSCAEKVSWLS
jgi:hypothetical protein